MTPRVSVVLPAYNAATTLDAAIASLRAQTFADWELVVVDDGSTDRTAERLATLAATEPRLRVVSRPHAGIVAALGAGIASARAPLIARMDADDVCLPERLAEQVAFLERDPSLGLVGCLVEFGGDRVSQAGYARHVDWLNTLQSPDEIAANRFVDAPFAHPSVLFRRALIERFGGYAAGAFPEDYELWLRWLEAGVRMAKVPRVLLRWNDPEHRLSRTDPRYATEAFFRLKARWIAAEVRRRARARELWVWGAGRPTRRRAEHLTAHGLRIHGYIDVDPAKATPALGGRGAPVITPAELPGPEMAFVLGYVTNPGARQLIHRALANRGYAIARDYLPCA